MEPVRIESSCLADMLGRVIDGRDLTAVQPAIDFLTECGRAADAEWLRREVGRMFVAMCWRPDTAGAFSIVAPTTLPDPKLWAAFAQQTMGYFASDLYTFESIVNTVTAALTMPRPQSAVAFARVGGY